MVGNQLGLREIFQRVRVLWQGHCASLYTMHHWSDLNALQESRHALGLLPGTPVSLDTIQALAYLQYERIIILLDGLWQEKRFQVTVEAFLRDEEMPREGILRRLRAEETLRRIQSQAI